MTEILTIGHSNHDMLGFLGILRKHGVTLLVDIRSDPHSRYAPQFNKHDLQRAIEAEGIEYRYSGSCLGGRPKDPSLYTEAGKPDYDRLAATEAFRKEIEVVVGLSAKKRVALMCSEADPIVCHRERIIAPVLRGIGVKVVHIMPDGTAAEVAQQGLC